MEGFGDEVEGAKGGDDHRDVGVFHVEDVVPSSKK